MMRKLLAAAFLLLGCFGASAANPPTNYTTQTTPYDGTESFYCERTSGPTDGMCTVTNILKKVGASFTGTPSNPTGTANTTGLMMGLGSTCTITPTKSGVVQLNFVGTVVNSSTGGCGFGIRYGTGSAPANAAANTGTTLGTSATATPSSASIGLPFPLIGVVSGLTINTAYWFDINLGAITTGTCTISTVTCSAMEQ